MLIDYSMVNPERCYMPKICSSKLRQAHIDAAQIEFSFLAQKGVRIEGNVFSSLLFIKGTSTSGEGTSSKLMDGIEAKALRAAFGALGWPPEDECVLSTLGEFGDSNHSILLDPELFRIAVETIDAEAIVLLDDTAVEAMQLAYAEELSSIEDFNVAMLSVGSIAHVLGRRILALQGFADCLNNSDAKQVMWAYIKKLPPLSEPY